MEKYWMELETMLEEKVLLLFAAEREKERALYQLEKMEKVADEANAKFTDANTKLNSVTEALCESNQELKIKRQTIESLKIERRKLEEYLEAKLAEKDESLEKLKAELSYAESSNKKCALAYCMKRAADEKFSVLEENSKLLDLLRTANNTNKMIMRENQKLRELLVQALNKANAAKQAERTATVEYSQLRNAVAEKSDDAFVFISGENPV